ncbi:MAG: calcium-binding protein [Pseudomonadota bacterium]
MAQIHGSDNDDTMVGLTAGQTLIGGNGVDTLQYDDRHTIVITATEGVSKSGYIQDGDTIIAHFEDFENLEPIKVDPDRVDGTNDDDVMGDGHQDFEGNAIGGSDGIIDKINGHEGSDDIDAGSGNDLAAGDTVGAEWSLVNGKWVYDPSKIYANGSAKTFDDVIRGGDGDDVILGNGGNDTLYGDAGDDLINAGTGDDNAYGGTGDDVLNLEDGDDYAEGGQGADIINAGAGDDLVYGDDNPENLLTDSTPEAGQSIAQFSGTDWIVNENQDTGQTEMSQSVDTEDGEPYTVSIDVAVNFAGGATVGAVEVLWNGEVIDKVEVESGAFETFTYDVVGEGNGTGLTIRTAEPDGANSITYDTSGPIISYEKSVDLGDGPMNVDAFAPGQAKLFQVINGQLKVFDTETETYQDAGDPTGIKLNAIGFNVEDDLIYGIAKSAGTDALGQPVSVPDIVMMDANGDIFRVGDGHYGDYVGDFDGQGNLVTFHTSLNRVTIVDVDDIGPDGNPTIKTYHFDSDLSTDRMYDIAYNPQTEQFYSVVAPSKQGGEGKILTIDVSQVENGGQPIINEIPITNSDMNGMLYDGMVKGAYGAVFMDGSGNLYAGLNKGDHDMSTDTGVSGGIYKISISEDGDAAIAELMSEAQTTGVNDGAMDTRANDPFADVDADADILLKDISVAPKVGGNDSLRGGEGDDTMFGGMGDDELFGGTGDDVLDGETGNDKVFGGEGNDQVAGGAGNDFLKGDSGDDFILGGEGNDTLAGGIGNDRLADGAGNDKIIAGKGADTIEMGAGDDHIWGGQWTGDGEADTFVLSSGSGKDIIHDFEADHDVIDLSAYEVSYEDLQGLMKDHGWAVEIDLSGLDGAEDGDRVFLKSVDQDQLDETNFVL